MKTKLTLLISIFFISAAVECAAQTRNRAKPRIGRTSNDTSGIRWKQRRIMKITDTTGFGTGVTKDSLSILNTRPGEPLLPPQNNPNHHNPGSSVVHPDRPALPRTEPKKGARK